MALSRQEIADINSVINKREMSESEAQAVLNQYIVNPKFSVSENLDLLVALCVIFEKEFDVNDYSIRYMVGDFSKVNSFAFHESTRGDNVIIIGVDSEFLTEPSKVQFLKVMLHEYGHLNMFLKNRGKKITPKSVVIASDIGNASVWQIIGALSSYNSCSSERNADLFAHKTINNLIKNKSNFTDLEHISAVKKEIHELKRKEDLRFYICKFLNGVWKVGDIVLKTKYPRKFRVFRNDNSYDKQIWDDNLKYPLVFSGMDCENPEDYVKHHTRNNDSSIKGFSKKKKMSILARAFLKYSLMMSSKCKVHPQELGFMFSDYYSSPEYINTRDKNPDSPLLGYFIYPTKRAEEVQSLGEFFQELDKCYNEKISEEETNRS